MVFKRRDRRPLWRIVLESLWPKGGWARAAQYVRHRVNRLPDPPERIARGIFAGIFTTFTPFYGFHFVFAAGLALLMRGNVVAAILATFFGNPLTYVPIGVVSLKTGYWLLGLEAHPEHGSLTYKFMRAGQDLWDNLRAIFTGGETHWADLAIFYHEVFFPYMIGGILPGVIVAALCYKLSVPLITAYQNRRKGLVKLRNTKIGKGADGAPPSD